MFAFARRCAKPACRPPGSHPQLVLKVSSAEVMSLSGTYSGVMFVVWLDAGVLGLCLLLRGGVPSLRVDRQVRIHSWFSKYRLQK